MSRPEFDPIAWLRDHDPAEHLAGVTVAEEDLRALFEQVVVAGSARRRRSRRKVAAVVVAASVAVATAAAAVVLNRRPADGPPVVVCYSQADPMASQAIVPLEGDPVASCLAAWADPDKAEVFGGRPAPPLVACVDAEGRATVVPDEGDVDPCELLGLPHADPPTVDGARVQGVVDALVDRLLGTCTAPEEVADLARRELAAAGLQDWTVVVDGPAAEGASCGSIAVDAPSATIHIVPIPPRPR